MSGTRSYRLEGLEPDNLLAFLALLGLLRALDTADRERGQGNRMHARAAWDLDTPPLRPTLYISDRVAPDEMFSEADAGLEMLAASHDFDGRKDLNHTRRECRTMLNEAAMRAGPDARDYADLLAALVTDAAVKESKPSVDPTPLCLLFGQGHQHFLDRLATVPRTPAPPPRGKRAKAVRLSPMECLHEALFQPWQRSDITFSFRWDPEEAVRYALMAGDPTDPAYQAGTQHGANRLASVGLAALTLVPETRGTRVRPAMIGGASGPDGFSFAWPIWRDPATLAGIRGLLAHPELRQPGGVDHLGVDHVLVARRISVGQFMNFSRARPIMATPSAGPKSGEKSGVIEASPWSR